MTPEQVITFKKRQKAIQARADAQALAFKQRNARLKYQNLLRAAGVDEKEQLAEKELYKLIQRKKQVSKASI